MAMAAGGEAVESLNVIDVDQVYYGISGTAIKLQDRISVVNLFRLLSLIPHSKIRLSDGSQIKFRWDDADPDDLDGIFFSQFYALRFCLGLQRVYSHQFYKDAISKALTDTLRGRILLKDRGSVPGIIEEGWALQLKAHNTYVIIISGKEYEMQVSHPYTNTLHVELDSRRTTDHKIWGIGIRVTRELPPHLAPETVIGVIASPGSPPTPSRRVYITPSPMTAESKAFTVPMQDLKAALDLKLANGFYESLLTQRGQATVPVIHRRFKPVMTQLDLFYAATYRDMVKSPEFTQMSHRPGTPPPMDMGGGAGAAVLLKF